MIAAILGIVEGLTEFLPVSSTGHMIIVGQLLGFTGEKAATFEVVIQLGSILAVVVVFWRKMFRPYWHSFWKRGRQKPTTFESFAYYFRYDSCSGFRFTPT